MKWPLGNGAIVRGKGVCLEVMLNLGVIGVKEKKFPLKFGCMDIMVGEAGEHYNQLEITNDAVSMEWRKVVLRGVLSLGRSKIPLRAMIKAYERSAVGC